MKRRKLRKYVLPVVFVLLIAVSFMVINAVSNYMLGGRDNYEYSKDIIKDNSSIIMKEESSSSGIVLPYLASTVKVEVDYYKTSDEKEVRDSSLIHYEKMYMPSTGILYSNSEKFDVVASYDGEVTKVSDDNILGKYIEVTHNQNLVTYYYSVDEVKVNVGDKINSGDIIASSAKGNLSQEHALLFEVYYQGKSMDPNDFYESDVTELA